MRTTFAAESSQPDGRNWEQGWRGWLTTVLAAAALIGGLYLLRLIDH